MIIERLVDPSPEGCQRVQYCAAVWGIFVRPATTRCRAAPPVAARHCLSSGTLVGVTSAPVERRECSAKGCSADADWVLAWNNPKIHASERRKAWLACEAHRDHLSQFLAARNFLRGTVPLQEWDGESLPGS